MKKLILFLLAVCMCFSATVMLTSCGGDEEHTHTYKAEWTFDNTHHWHKCEGDGCSDVSDKAEHSWNEGKITTTPTEEKDGVKTFSCTVCGQTKTESIPAKGHTHSYKAEWTFDDTHHWHECEGDGCSDVSDKAEHSWNEGEITTEPTEEKGGVKTFSCTVCGQTKTESIPAKGHTHSYKTDWTSDDTHHWHECEGDGCSDVSDKAEHKWDEGKITTAATPDADGVKTFTCTVCAKTRTEAVKHTHTYKIEWASDDTHHWHECEDGKCTDVSDKAEHTWNEGKITTEATPDADGVKTFTCTVCEKTKTEAVKYSAKTTVEKENWVSLLNSLYDRNLYIAMSAGIRKSSITSSANVIKEVNTVGDVTTTEYYANENGLTYIYKCRNNTWYKQPYITSDNWGSGVLESVDHTSWEKVHFWNTDSVVDDMLPISLLTYDIFSYDEDEKAYFCKSVEIDYGYSSDYLTDMYIYFENDKLVKIKYNYCDDTVDNPVYDCYFSCEADDVVIPLPDKDKVVILPTDYSEADGTDNKLYGEYDWQMAIMNFQKDHRIYYVDSDKEITIFKDKIKIVDEIGTTYYANENNDSYVYIYEGERWRKELEGVYGEDDTPISWETRLRSTMYSCFGNEILYNIFWEYDLFEYDAETKAYCLDELESYKNIKLSFENGKLKSVSFEYYESKISLSYVYNDFALPKIEA